MNSESPCRISLQQGAFIMEGTYGVYFGKQLCGKVQVLRKGLYYHFHCRCRLSGEVLCRLTVSCGKQQENLGVVIPADGCFGLDTKLPAKRFTMEEPVFNLIPKTAEAEGQFIPIYPEEPFAYIERLKDAFLVRKYGQAGILLK